MSAWRAEDPLGAVESGLDVDEPDDAEFVARLRAELEEARRRAEALLGCPLLRLAV